MLPRLAVGLAVVASLSACRGRDDCWRACPPPEAPDASLSLASMADVVGTANEAWAAGARSVDGTYLGEVLLRWDGCDWKVSSSQLDDRRLNRVSAIAAAGGDVWVAASRLRVESRGVEVFGPDGRISTERSGPDVAVCDDDGRILHRGGDDWSEVTSPKPDAHIPLPRGVNARDQWALAAGGPDEVWMLDSKVRRRLSVGRSPRRRESRAVERQSAHHRPGRPQRGQADGPLDGRESRVAMVGDGSHPLVGCEQRYRSVGRTQLELVPLCRAGQRLPSRRSWPFRPLGIWPGGPALGRHAMDDGVTSIGPRSEDLCTGVHVGRGRGGRPYLRTRFDGGRVPCQRCSPRCDRQRARSGHRARCRRRRALVVAARRRRAPGVALERGPLGGRAHSEGIRRDAGIGFHDRDQMRWPGDVQC